MQQSFVAEDAAQLEEVRQRLEEQKRENARVVKKMQEAKAASEKMARQEKEARRVETLKAGTSRLEDMKEQQDVEVEELGGTLGPCDRGPWVPTSPPPAQEEVVDAKSS